MQDSFCSIVYLLVCVPSIYGGYPFLRLQPFSSQCAKSSNIVGRESKKRKPLSSTAFQEALAFLSKPNQARLSGVCHQFPESRVVFQYDCPILTYLLKLGYVSFKFVKVDLDNLEYDRLNCSAFVL